MFDRIKEFIKKGSNFKQCHPDMSFKELVHQRFLPKNASVQEVEWAHYIMQNQYSLPNGADQDKVSAKLINDFYKFAGDEHFINGGYSRITNALARAGFPITLNLEVKEVNYINKQSVTVQTTCGKTLEADHVIVTLPLGVLKQGNVKFTPELPKSKQTAIGRLGCSLLEKLFLEFEEVFWDKSCDLINIVQDEWTLMVNYYKHNARKPVLCMFNYGSHAHRFN
jgi:monoamine oxidase